MIERKEKIARIYRDAFFERTTTDNNWQHCQEPWVKALKRFEEGLAQVGLKIVEDEKYYAERADKTGVEHVMGYETRSDE